MNDLTKPQNIIKVFLGFQFTFYPTCKQISPRLSWQDTVNYLPQTQNNLSFELNLLLDSVSRYLRSEMLSIFWVRSYVRHTDLVDDIPNYTGESVFLRTTVFFLLHNETGLSSGRRTIIIPQTSSAPIKSVSQATPNGLDGYFSNFSSTIWSATTTHRASD